MVLNGKLFQPYRQNIPWDVDRYVDHFKKRKKTSNRNFNRKKCETIGGSTHCNYHIPSNGQEKHRKWNKIKMEKMALLRSQKTTKNNPLRVKFNQIWCTQNNHCTFGESGHQDYDSFRNIFVLIFFSQNLILLSTIFFKLHCSAPMHCKMHFPHAPFDASFSPKLSPAKSNNIYLLLAEVI